MLAGYAQEFPDLTFSQITNGTLLTPENLQYMKGLKHVKFFISLDTLNPLVYSSIRIGAKLSDALANIRSLRENLRAIGVEQVDIIFLTLLMKRTILGIPAVIDFAKEIDATVILKHVYKQGIVTHHESLYHYPIFSNNFLTQCKQYAESKGVNFSPPPPFAEGPETEKDRKRDEQNAKAHGCTYLNHPGVILIEHQGDFYMCSGLVRLGNLREKTFEELFLDNKDQVYREAFKSGKLIEPCATKCRCKIDVDVTRIHSPKKFYFDITPEERNLNPVLDFEKEGFYDCIDELDDDTLRKNAKAWRAYCDKLELERLNEACSENQQRIQNVIQRIEALKASQEKVMIYPAGSKAKHLWLLDEFDVRDLNVIGAADKNPKRRTYPFFDMKVHSPEEICKLGVKALLVVASPKILDEIYDELKYLEEEHNIELIKI
ncbi:MAG: hypothetical protein KAR45_15080, partial [Desulfobacteraceae bacterium]|nr:hypothetical protein [Desulfobacteraceae bacterium]